MKKILVPVDFSEPSANALQVAAKIAKQQQAEIVVLHMLGLSEAVMTKNETQEFEEAKFYMELAKKRFQTFLDKPYLRGIKIKKIVQNYKVFKELNKVSKEQNVDLIVMGSHGTSGFNEYFGGSNTAKVVRTSDVPVLIIKAPSPNFDIKRVLFACSFNDDSVLAFKNVEAFAQRFSARLSLLYINTPYDDFLSTSEAEARISDFLVKAGEKVRKVEIYNDYSVEKGLQNYAIGKNVDILAIPTHGRKGLSHFFLGSIGEDVANHANLPVMTFKI
jgi:nucleotide-binding universal stress UspA family protein